MALALMCSNALFAQSDDDNYVIDEKEDVSDVQTIKDIVKNQQKVTHLSTLNESLSKAWSRKRYFNIAYTTEKLTPVNTIAKNNTTLDWVPITDVEAADASEYFNEGKAPVYKSDWGITLQNGANYRLHKNPILKTVAFNIDFNWMDLSAAHYAKVDGGEKKVIDNNNYGQQNQEYGYYYSSEFYAPFNSEKYNISYGMGIGPSITVAPFTHTKIQALYHLKFNAYFHIGYNASLLLITNDEGESASASGINGLSLDFGHGLYYEFGFDMSWKMIGFGFERRTTTYKYKALKSDIYRDEKYTFDAASSRIFLQLRF